MEMVNFRAHSEEKSSAYSATVHEEDDMDRYSPTSPTENSPIQSPVLDRSRTPNRYSPTNPTDDVDDLEDHIFRTDRTGEELSPPADKEYDSDNVAKEGAYRTVGTEDNNSQNDDDSDCDSENRLVIQEEVEEEKEGEAVGTEDETGDTEHCDKDHNSKGVHPSSIESIRLPGETESRSLDGSPLGDQAEESQKEKTHEFEDDPLSIVNLESIPLPASEPEDNRRGEASDVLQLSADNDLETRHNDVDARKHYSDDSSSDESEDSREKSKERSSSSSSSSSSEQSPEYEQSPDSPSSSEHQSHTLTGEKKSQNESDKESSGEILDDSVDDENFRHDTEKSNKGSKTGASPNHEDSGSRCVDDGIDIIEMSVDLDDKDYTSEPRLSGFDGASKSSPALGVTRVIQRVSVENEGRADGDCRTVQAEEDSDDDVQIIECPPQEPIDTLIVDDDDDDDVIPCGNGDPRKTVSDVSRSHRSKKKRTVEHDGHDLRIVIREERRDRDEQDRSRRHGDKGSRSRREERQSDSHRRDESNHHSSEYASRRRHRQSQSHSRERRRSRRSRSRSRSRDRSSRRRRHGERSREHERSSERERERDREKSHRKKRHDRKHEHSHKSRSRSRSHRRHREDSWDKENHEDNTNREHTSYRQYKNRHYRHHEESGQEESPIVESHERKRKKRKREHRESSTRERRRRRREEDVADRSHRMYAESPVIDRRHRKHVEEREASPVSDRRRRRHTEREEIAFMEESSRSRRHVEQREESPRLEKRRRRRMKEKESSPYIERRSERHTEEQFESPIVPRKSRRHVEEYEEAFSDERRSRSRRQREEQEESFVMERTSRRSRRHVEEQNESPLVERRGRRHAEEREEFAQVERKHRKHVEILAESLPERRNRSRKHADEWDEPPIDDRNSRRHVEELQELPVERKRTQSATWSPSDTFQKDPSDSSDSDSSSSQESEEASEEDSEEEEEEVERQVVLVNRDEDEEQIESSEKDDEDIQSDDDFPLSKSDTHPAPESDDVSVHEVDDVSGNEVENVPSPESEPSEKEPTQPSMSEEDELEEIFPLSKDSPCISTQNLEELTSKPDSSKDGVSTPSVSQKATPEEAVYDPAHPTESETDKGLFPESPKVLSKQDDKVDDTHSPRKSPAEEKVVDKTSGDGSSSLGSVPKKDSVTSEVTGTRHHLMVNSVLARQPFARTLPRPLAAPPLPPGFRLQIGGPGGPIIKSSSGQLLPPGPPPLPRGLSDTPNKKSEGEFSTSGASESTNTAVATQPSALHTVFQSNKEGKAAVDKFDNTLANLVVAQNLLSAMKEGGVGGQSSVVPPPKSVFRVPQPPIPPPPKPPVKLPPSSSSQSLSSDSRELMDMDMSPLDDECELELPTPPDLSDEAEDKQKTSKPPLAAVNLKALTSVIKKLTSQPADDMPASAVELTNKEKYLKKLHLQERVVDEVKQALRPFYSHKKITKEEYKGILRKAVPKICHSKSGNINPQKILQLVEGYVNKFQKQRHSAGKKDKSSKTSKERMKANGERSKSTR
ncbi:uncharacterized protein LOC143286803 [Babylonia areolata]|uniref:uncharacterized protein LOC143286803 n=1 Tax=Babylonia areolata TaxID=304850 RepID=UPI003FCF62C8